MPLADHKCHTNVPSEKKILEYSCRILEASILKEEAM
jgi:hypothetical protein